MAYNNTAGWMRSGQFDARPQPEIRHSRVRQANQAFAAPQVIYLPEVTLARSKASPLSQPKVARDLYPIKSALLAMILVDAFLCSLLYLQISSLVQVSSDNAFGAIIGVFPVIALTSIVTVTSLGVSVAIFARLRNLIISEVG